MLDLSIEDLKLAIDKEKECPDAFNNLGLSYFDKGWYRYAVE
jgi:hypothetical protein